jgi:glycosyltransferase involved in cell wall biosynthesis/predicted O-methyltransferase YrrM
MKVTLYAIAKNEEKNIEKFLLNAKKFDDVVVVDTGSTDNTIQLLKDAGIKVYEHSQTREEFDFSVARNEALSYVETDWAFSLDFNEDVDEFFANGLDFVSDDVTVFKHQRYDDNGEGEPLQSFEVHTRFHRKENYTWINAVHEIPKFIPTEQFPEEYNVDTTIKITKKINKSISKELFYLSICEREYEKDPTNEYYIWFIFNHYCKVNSPQKVLQYGQEYLNVSKPYSNNFRIDIFIRCSMILINSGNIQSGVNYAFHALSESMVSNSANLSSVFNYLIDVGKKINSPDIVIFASSFSQNTKYLPERTESIEKLFLTNLDDIPATAWTGHRNFAQWLVNEKKPEVIVDLGTDWGFSAFSFGMPRIGHVYTIDNFTGDSFVGEQNTEQKYNYVMQKREKLFMQDNVSIIKGDFSEIAKTWDKPIDILHIDGDHAYESIKNDFETWIQFLKEDGIILMHDTCVEEYNDNSRYGVKKFFEEIDLPKCNFTHTFGLGVVSKNKDLIDFIEKNFNLDVPL